MTSSTINLPSSFKEKDYLGVEIPEVTGGDWELGPLTIYFDEIARISFVLPSASESQILTNIDSGTQTSPSRSKIYDQLETFKTPWIKKQVRRIRSSAQLKSRKSLFS